MSPIDAPTAATSASLGGYAVPDAGGPPTAIIPLPAAGPGGDIGAALAALAVRSGEVERSEARAARSAEEALAWSEAQAQVSALRSEASSLQCEAVFDGSVTLLEACAGGKSKVMGAALAGVKSGGDGLLAADQKNDEALAKGHEAAASSAHAGADDARDAASGADQLIQAALDFYREYIAARGQAASAAAGRP